MRCSQVAFLLLYDNVHLVLLPLGYGCTGYFEADSDSRILKELARHAVHLMTLPLDKVRIPELEGLLNRRAKAAKIIGEVVTNFSDAAVVPGCDVPGLNFGEAMSLIGQSAFDLTPDGPLDKLRAAAETVKRCKHGLVKLAKTSKHV